MEITKSINSHTAKVTYVKSKGSTKLLALEIKPLVDILDSNLTIQDVPVILSLLQSHKSSSNQLIYLKDNERPDTEPGEIVVWLSIQDLLLLQSCGLTNDRKSLDDSHILKSWPLLYGIDTEIYSVLKYLQQADVDLKAVQTKKNAI